MCTVRYGMKMPRLGTKDLESAQIAIPPPAEQKRIVAKVDELMALCDRLEAQQQERESKHAALARASLARFADAPTPANLNFLFHPSYTIAPADVRKTILTLAVQGKLVPQDPDDESAEEIVGRVSKLRETFATGKRVKAAKRLRELDDSSCGHNIPDIAYAVDSTKHNRWRLFSCRHYLRWGLVESTAYPVSG